MAKSGAIYSIPVRARIHYVPATAVDQVWQDFWLPILAPDGRVDPEQVKKELHDYRYAMIEVRKVYDKLTGGAIRNIHTRAEVVLAAIEEHAKIQEELFPQ